MSTHLITGATSGIGAVVAERLTARGDEVWLLARDAGRAGQLAQRFPGARTLVADLAEPERIASALEHQELPDRLDSLMHIAGIAEFGQVGELSQQLWNLTLAVNLTAPAELTRLFLPQLRACRGHVIFLNSGQGLRANAGWSAYAAGKHGLKALADALREEEHDGGVRVTTVYPGRTATPMQEKLHRQSGVEYDPSRWITADSVATTVLTAIDLPRDAEITDLTVRPGR
jgi:NADP-dependent 3-hydroxy acid dehydrogenase YdfG